MTAQEIKEFLFWGTQLSDQVIIFSMDLWSSIICSKQLTIALAKSLPDHPTKPSFHIAQYI